MSLLGIQIREQRKTWRLTGGDDDWEIYITADRDDATVTVEQSLDGLDVEIARAISEVLQLATEWLTQ